MIKLEYWEYIIGFLWIIGIFLLIISLTFGLRNFFETFGVMGILIPSGFLYIFGLIGFYLFKRKNNNNFY